MTEKVRLEIETEVGSIIVDIDPEIAPITSNNFLSYVDNGFYEGGHFWRTVTMDNQPDAEVRIDVIQGGVNPDRADEVGEPIKLERTTESGLSHVDGTISMGRFAPDSAHSEFFICIGDQPELDYGGRRNPDGQGFAAFGRVISGMDVVRSIQTSRHERQRLSPPIVINHIRRMN
jgi:peptidyl-prolyl cis-trans isomerase A (cyclophilin A)